MKKHQYLRWVALVAVVVLVAAGMAGASVVTVTVDPSTIEGNLVTLPSLQVVAHRLLFRDSPIHDNAFKFLAALGAKHVRVVPWFPYPLVGVAAMDPPSGTALCDGYPTPSGSTLSLDCGPYGGVIETVDFASYGTPTGTCGRYATGKCHAANSSEVVRILCAGQRQCDIQVPEALFGDPCFGVDKTLAAQVSCSNSTQQHTYWSFGAMDPFIRDVWDAVVAQGGDDDTIMNWSTPPTWLYDNASWVYPASPDTVDYGYETGTAPASNLTQLGDYYGRLLAYFVRGEFHDEYGNLVQSHQPTLNITTYEVFNEPHFEHKHTAETYTIEYDAIVAGIRRALGEQYPMRYVGLNMANIDDTSTVVSWAQHFLDKSNHADPETAPLDLIGFHAYPQGNITANASSFETFFEWADVFIDRVAQVDAVRKALSPSTKFALDECGTAAPHQATPGSQPVYWVASGSYYVYLWSRLSENEAVEVVGESQLMDDVQQEGPVTMLDWTTGLPNARYWALKLLIALVPLEDGYSLVATTTSSADVFARGYFSTAARATRVVVVNKVNAAQTVSVPGAPPSATATVVDASIDLATGPTAQPFHGSLQLEPFATAVVAWATG